MKVKSESEVAQSCWTLETPWTAGPPDSSIHGIFQARVLEWGAIAFSVGDAISLLMFGSEVDINSVLGFIESTEEGQQGNKC